MKHCGAKHVKGLVQGFLIVKWFAHAHEDDVAHHAPLGPQQPVDLNDLVQDLGRRQVVGQPHGAGRAKRAAHGAANLGRYAQGCPPGGNAQDHRFDQLASGRLEQQFARAIDAGVVPRLQVERMQSDIVGEGVAVLFGQFAQGHLRIGMAFEESIAELPEMMAIDPGAPAIVVEGSAVVDAKHGKSRPPGRAVASLSC